MVHCLVIFSSASNSVNNTAGHSESGRGSEEESKSLFEDVKNTETATNTRNVRGVSNVKANYGTIWSYSRKFFE